MRRSITGGAAAGMLPAALLVSVLCSAPFAGTTTAPLAADQQPATSQNISAPDRHTGSGGGAAALIAGEAALGAVGAGVVYTVARRDARRRDSRHRSSAAGV